MSALLAVSQLRKVHGPGCEACASQPPRVCPRCGSVLGCDAVSFDVHEGEVLGIVGESGSGKSTVLSCLNLDVPATAGSIVFDGDEVTDVTGARRRRLRTEALGVVYQHAERALDLDVTAGGNVAGRLLGGGWRGYDAVRAQAPRFHGEVELEPDPLDTPVVAFSGGMRQRVQLARALASSPRLLLLDEPTSGLDVSVQARILDLIGRLRREQRLTMVIVSHDLAVIRMLAERVIVMRHGRVIESGLTDQVLADPQDPYTQLLVSAQLQ